MALEKDLENFFRREFAKNRGEKPLIKITVRHAASGAKGLDVTSIDLADRESISIDDMNSLSDEILSIAQTDADGQGGVNRYVVYLHAKDEPRTVAKHPFKLRGIKDEFDEEGGDEPATLKGLVAQQMRHTEAMAKTMVHSVQGITQIMARRLEESDRTISRIMEVNQKNQQLLEDARNEEHTRNMELLQFEAKETRKSQMFEKLSVLVPVVLNKLAGQKIMNADDPMVMMLKSFSESLSPEQMKSIQGTLKPEQAILLINIMKSTNQKQLSNGEDKSS